MTGRRLDAEERALWARVAATVTPLEKRATSSPPAPAHSAERGHAQGAGDAPGAGPRSGGERRAAAPQARPAATTANTLDASWDRRLRRGLVGPERSIDLHGHTLAMAHAALEAALAQAVADDVRLLLVVTGRPPRAGDARRGLIRAQIGDWLAGSTYRDRIAAIRHAHPRHGGAGALYLVLRRRRG